jgi:hypothetical protein
MNLKPSVAQLRRAHSATPELLQLLTFHMPTETLPRPNLNTYWVIPHKFLAGEYPGNKDPVKALESLKDKRCCREVKFYSGVSPLTSRWSCLSRILRAGPRPWSYQILKRILFTDRNGGDNLRPGAVSKRCWLTRSCWVTEKDVVINNTSGGR